MVTRRGAPGEDHDAVTREVLADGLAPSLRERLAGSAPSRMGARHRTVLVRVAMLLAATTLGVGAAVHALRAADAPAVAAPRLVGISISETPPGPDPAVRGAVEATYRFAPLAPGSRLRLAGLAGPLVHASATRRVPAARGGGPVSGSAPHRPAGTCTSRTRRRLATPSL